MALITLAAIINESNGTMQVHQLVQVCKRGRIPLHVHEMQPAVDVLHAERVRLLAGLAAPPDPAEMERIRAVAALPPLSLAEKVGAVHLPVDTEKGREALRVAHGFPAKLSYMAPAVEPAEEE